MASEGLEPASGAGPSEAEGLSKDGKLSRGPAERADERAGEAAQAAAPHGVGVHGLPSPPPIMSREAEEGADEEEGAYEAYEAGEYRHRTASFTMLDDGVHPAQGEEHAGEEGEEGEEEADVYFDFDEPNTPAHIVFTSDEPSGSGAPSGAPPIADLGGVLMPGRGVQKPAELKGGTLNKLVERLTFPGGVEPTFLNAFLLTYRSFTTPTILLKLLRSRFAVPLPHNVTDAELALFHTCVVKPVRLRVINVTKHWLKLHRYDFDTDGALRDACLHFVDEICATHASYAVHAKTLRQHLISSRWRAASLLAMAERQATEECEDSESGRESGASWPPSPLRRSGYGLQPVPLHLLNTLTSGGVTIPTRKLGSPPSGLMELPAVDVAFQLILNDSKLFKAIQPKECLRKAWSSPRLKHSATNVLALSAHFNAITFWIIWELTYEPALKDRARVLLRFVEIAICCYEHRAYCSALEVLAAVNGSAVARLEATWREMRSMARKEDLKRWDELVARLSFGQNYKAPLALLDNCEPPCVPYLGIFLTQLTKLEEGAPDTLTPPALTPPALTPPALSSLGQQAELCASTSSASSHSSAASTSSATGPSVTPPPTPDSAARPAAPALSSASARESCVAPLINMSKRRRIASIIARIQTYQNGTYRFAAAPQVVSYLVGRVGPWELALFDESLSTHHSRGPAERAIDKALYDASLLCEPRAPAGGGGDSSPRRGSVMPGAEFLFNRTTPRSGGSHSPEAKTNRRGSMP